MARHYSNSSTVTEKIRREYILDLKRTKSIDLSAEEYQTLKAAGVIVDRKQKVINKFGKTILLTVVRLARDLLHRCYTWREPAKRVEESGKKVTIGGQIHIEILRELREYVDRDVARQLASQLGKLIKYYALAEV